MQHASIYIMQAVRNRSELGMPGIYSGMLNGAAALGSILL